MMLPRERNRKSNLNSLGGQSGNVFFAIFGAVALVGVLGAGVATFIKGPLATSVKLTKANTAENQMAIGAQIAVMATASQATGGDCEDPDGAGPLTGDGFVEPMEWRSPTTEPVPTNGGLVPLTLGISKKDPWGTEYGFCVWNHGPTTSGSGCGANMLAGTNSTAYPVVALISAGPDKTFTTTCRTFATADANTDGDLDDGGDSPLVSKAAETDDDIITTYTYEEATGVSGGLWALKSGDPGTATIGKNIETTGTASLQGGILLPDKSLITCDASTAGVMAMNGNAIEICDGAGNWTAITGGGTLGGPGLVLDIVNQTGMDITAPCGQATCYSSNVTFTLTNNITPAATSDTLVVSLSNTTDFEKVSDNCNGNTLAAAATCQIVVRAKATTNKSYTATLSITGNNNPLATLAGTSTGFGCTVGGTAPGGYYIGCGLGGYNLVAQPGGCTGTTSNPTCAGGADTVRRDSCTSVPSTYSSSNSGQQATADFMGYTGGGYAYAAAAYCDQMQYGGYDDWFLPSLSELTNYFYPNRALIGGSIGTNAYISVSMSSGNAYYMLSTGASAWNTCGNTSGGNAQYVRCARWDPAKTTAPITDNTPVAVTFTPSSGTTAGETRTSNTITVYEVTAPVTVSVSGGTGAQYSKNGGAYTSAAGTVTNGDTITLQATSPIAGQQDIISLTVGNSSFSWNVRTVANNTIYAFVTSATTTGGVTISGADSMCASAASSAGLSGTWLAMIATGSGTSDGPANRIPWNWTTLKNMNNQAVATSFTDLTDGTISAAINRTAANAASPNTYAWTGSQTATGLSGSNAGLSTNPCNSWTFSGGGAFAYIGAVNSTTTHFNSTSSACSNSYAIYCVQDPGAALVDTDPAAVSIRPGVAYSAGAAATSNTVTVTAILQPVTVTITPSAGTADIIVNGVAQGATTVNNVAPNSTVQFSLTVPAVLGTKNTATITIGDDNYTWWVGYADGAKEAKVFVTSASFNAAMGGLTGADTLCNTYAAASSLGLSSSWVAMLSDSSTDMAARIPWNWGVLKTTTGAIVVDGGYNDLFDGTFDSPIGFDQDGSARTVYAFTGSNIYGLRYSTTGTTSWSWGNNWTEGNCVTYGYGIGLSTSTTVGLYQQGDGCNSRALYCIENVDTSSDTTPATVDLKYPVQVTASSRQSSTAWIVSGMSSGATTTLSVTATAGNPTFTINGGAEVTSGTIQNGDSVIFKLDAPATDNSSNKMTITAGGSTTLGYWRVWTGDSTGTVVKRAFVYFPGWGSSTNQGAMTGLDAVCQARATSAGLGGTWKAIASGQGDDENQWAVNRIGYNWSTLRRVDGVDIVYAGNIWSTDTTPLLNPIVKDMNNVTQSTTVISTGSTVTGKAAIKTSNGQCRGFSDATTDSSSYAIYRATSGATNSGWINNGTNTYSYYCNGYSFGGVYCIEQ